MNQSAIIATALLAGFVLFLAARDRLRIYANVLWGGTSAPLPSSQTQAQSKSDGGSSIFEDVGGIAKDGALAYFGFGG